MVRKYTFSMIFLVLVCVNVLQGQPIGTVFPNLVKRLALDNVGEIAHTFLTDASDVTSGFTKRIGNYIGNFHKESFGLPRQFGKHVLTHIESALGAGPLGPENAPPAALATPAAIPTD